METQKDKIRKVLDAFFGVDSEEDMSVVLDDEEIEILTTALDEALN